MSCGVWHILYYLLPLVHMTQFVFWSAHSKEPSNWWKMVFILLLALLGDRLFGILICANDLEDLWHHGVDGKWCKITKNGISLQLLHSSQSSMIYPEWSPDPLHLKSKIRVFLRTSRSVICSCFSFSGCLANMNITQPSTIKSVRLWSNK